jgi:cyanate permease
LLGGLAVPVFAVGGGWRWAFVAGALLAALASLAAGFTRGGDTGATRNQPAPVSTGAAGRTTLGILALGIGLGGAAASALAAFLVATGVEAGLSEAASGAWLMVGSVCGLVVRLGSGAVADRCPVRPLSVVVAMLAIGTFAFLALAAGVPWMHCLATPIAFGAGWAWPGLFNLAVVRAFREAPARATGVTQTGTYVGAVLGPLIFGVVAERSYPLAWIAATAMMIASAFAMHLADRRLRTPG